MPWLYNCAFPVETMEEQNGLGFVSPIGWFEPTHNAIKTICRESKCKSRAELAKLAWAIMLRCSFAYSKKKRWVLCVSNHQSVILVSFFSLCLKRGYRKKGKIGWCIGLHLEGSSPLRWTIRSPFKSTVHFYRECERVMVCGWDRERLYYCISYLFPKCSLGSMVLLILLYLKSDALHIYNVHVNVTHSVWIWL